MSPNDSSKLNVADVCICLRLWIKDENILEEDVTLPTQDEVTKYMTERIGKQPWNYECNPVKKFAVP
jgi:hypothetical protein